MSDPAPAVHSDHAPWPRLRALSAGVRGGLSLLVLVLAGGVIVSAIYMADHYENRDGTDGLTLDDITAHYHGVNAEAPLVRVLAEGHADPEVRDAVDVTDEERQRLLAWLEGGGNLSAGYDPFDTPDPDATPAAIIDRSCLSCHARDAEPGPAVMPAVSLEYWDDVERLAISRDVAPTEREILLASLHTHSISLALMSVVIALLAAMTAWPRRIVGVLVFLSGLGLLVDMGCWFLARQDERFVYLIVAGGWTWGATTMLLLAGILLDLWRPRRAFAATSSTSSSHS